MNKTNKRKFTFLKSMLICLAFFACLLTGGMLGVIENFVKAKNSDSTGGSTSSTGQTEQSDATILISLVKNGESYVDKNGNALYYHPSYGVVYFDEDKGVYYYYEKFVDGQYQDPLNLSSEEVSLLSDHVNKSGAEKFKLISQINNGETYIISNVQHDGSLADHLVYTNNAAISFGNVNLPANSKIFSDGENFFYFAANTQTKLMPIFIPDTNKISHFEKYETSADEIKDDGNDSNNISTSDVEKIYLNATWTEKLTSSKNELQSSVGVIGAQVGGVLYTSDPQSANHLFSEEIYIYSQTNGKVSKFEPTLDESILSGFLDADQKIYKVENSSDKEWYFDGTSSKLVESGNYLLARASTSDSFIVAEKPDDNSAAPYFARVGSSSSYFIQELTKADNEWYIKIGDDFVKLTHSSGNIYTYGEGESQNQYIMNEANNEFFLDLNKDGIYDDGTDTKLRPNEISNHFYTTGGHKIIVPESEKIKATLKNGDKWFIEDPDKVLSKKYTKKITTSVVDLVSGYADSSFTQIFQTKNQYFIDANQNEVFDDGDTTLNIGVDLIYQNGTYYWINGGLYRQLIKDPTSETKYSYTDDANITTYFYINPNFDLYFSDELLSGKVIQNFLSSNYYTKNGNEIGITAFLLNANGTGVVANPKYAEGYEYYYTDAEGNTIIAPSNETNQFSYYYKNGDEFFGVSDNLIENYEFYYLDGTTRNYVRNLESNIAVSKKEGFTSEISDNIVENQFSLTDTSLRISFGEFGNKLSDTVNSTIDYSLYHNGIKVSDPAFTLQKDSETGAYYIVWKENNINNTIGDWEVLFGCIKNGNTVSPTNQGYKVNNKSFYTQIKFSIVKESDYFVESARPTLKNAQSIGTSVNSTQFYNGTYHITNDANSQIPEVTFDTTKFKINVSHTSLNGQTNTFEIIRSIASRLEIIKNGRTTNLDIPDTASQAKKFSFSLTELGHYTLSYTPIVKQNNFYVELSASNLVNWTAISGFDLTNMGYQLQLTKYDNGNFAKSNFFAYGDILTLNDFAESNFKFAGDRLVNKRTGSKTAEISQTDKNLGSFDTAAEVNALFTSSFVDSIISTNQAPISFVFSGALTKTENKTNAYYWFKSAKGGDWTKFNSIKSTDFFDNAGLYLVCIEFMPTNASVTHPICQFFAFKITSSQAQYVLKDANDKLILNESFTNQDVQLQISALSEFDVRPQISVYYSDILYRGKTLYNKNLTTSDIEVLVENENYIFRSSRRWSIQLYFGPSVWTDKSTYVEWSFVIDKNPIKYTPYKNNTEIGDNVEVIGGNPAFNLHFGDKVIGDTQPLKISGAKIKAYYTYTPIVALNTAIPDDQKLVSLSGKDYVKTNFALDFSKTTEKTEYFIGTNKEAQGLYEFEIIDQAGNTSSYYIYIDNVKPEYVIGDNLDDTVAPRYEIVWGDYKATSILGTLRRPTKVCSDGVTEFISTSTPIANGFEDGASYFVSRISLKNLNFFYDGENPEYTQEARGLINKKTNLIESFTDEQAIQAEYKNYLEFTEKGLKLLKTKRNEGQFIVFVTDAYDNQAYRSSVTFTFDLSETTLYVKDANAGKTAYYNEIYPNLVNKTSSNLDYLFITAIKQGQTKSGAWKIESIEIDFYPLSLDENTYLSTPQTFYIYNLNPAVDILSSLTGEEIINVVNANSKGQTTNGKYVITRTYADGFTPPPDLFEAKVDSNGKAIHTTGVYYYDDTTGKLLSEGKVEQTGSTKDDLLSILINTGSTYLYEGVNYQVYERTFNFGDTDYDRYTQKRGVDTDEKVKTWEVYIDRVKPIDKTLNVGLENKLNLQEDGENLSFNQFVLDSEIVSLDTNLLPVVASLIENKYGNSASYLVFKLNGKILDYSNPNEQNIALDKKFVNGKYKLTIFDSVNQTILDSNGENIKANNVSFVFKAAPKAPVASFEEEIKEIYYYEGAELFPTGSGNQFVNEDGKTYIIDKNNKTFFEDIDGDKKVVKHNLTMTDGAETRPATVTYDYSFETSGDRSAFTVSHTGNYISGIGEDDATGFGSTLSARSDTYAYYLNTKSSTNQFGYLKSNRRYSNISEISFYIAASDTNCFEVSIDIGSTNIVSKKRLKTWTSAKNTYVQIRCTDLKDLEGEVKITLKGVSSSGRFAVIDDIQIVTKENRPVVYSDSNLKEVGGEPYWFNGSAWTKLSKIEAAPNFNYSCNYNSRTYYFNINKDTNTYQRITDLELKFDDLVKSSESRTIMLDNKTDYVSIKSTQGKVISLVIEDPDDFYQAKVDPSTLKQWKNGSFENFSGESGEISKSKHLFQTNYPAERPRMIYRITINASEFNSFKINFSGNEANYFQNGVNFYEKVYTLVVEHRLPTTNILGLAQKDDYITESKIDTSNLENKRDLKDYAFNIPQDNIFELATTSSYDADLKGIYPGTIFFENGAYFWQKTPQTAKVQLENVNGNKYVYREIDSGTVKESYFVIDEEIGAYFKDENNNGVFDSDDDTLKLSTVDRKIAVLDTYKIFFREVRLDISTDKTLSLASLMIGDEDFYLASEPNPRFSGVAGGYYFEFNYQTESFADALSRYGYDKNSNVELFEIIEMDAAGNYQSYYVYYTPFASPMIVEFNFENHFTEVGESAEYLTYHSSSHEFNTLNKEFTVNAVVNNNISDSNENATVADGFAITNIQTANRWFKLVLKNSENADISTLYHTSNTTSEDVDRWIKNNVSWNPNDGNTYFLEIYDRFDLERNIKITINFASKNKIAYSSSKNGNYIYVDAAFTQSQYISKQEVAYYTVDNLAKTQKLFDDNASQLALSSAKFNTTTYTFASHIYGSTAIYYFDVVDNFGRQSQFKFSIENEGRYFFEIEKNGSQNNIDEQNTEELVSGKQIGFEFSLLFYYDIIDSSISSPGIGFNTEVSSGKRIIVFDYLPGIDQVISIRLDDRLGDEWTFEIRQYTILPEINFRNNFNETLTANKTDENGFELNISTVSDINAIFTAGEIEFEPKAKLIYWPKDASIAQAITQDDIFAVDSIRSFNEIGNYIIVVYNTIYNTIGTQIAYSFAIDKEEATFYTVKSSSGQTLNPSIISAEFNGEYIMQYFTSDDNFKIYADASKKIRFINREDEIVEENGNKVSVATANNAYESGNGYWIFLLRSEQDSSLDFERFIKVNLVSSAPKPALMQDETQLNENVNECTTISRNGTTITFKTNLGSETNGNYLTAYVYFGSLDPSNLAAVVTPKLTSANSFEESINLNFNEAGTYFIRFVDLAQNVATFGLSNFFTVYNLSSVTGAIRQENGRQNSLLNDIVVANGATIAIDNFNRFTSVEWTIFKDGAEYLKGTSQEFVLEEVGNYYISFKAKVGSNYAEESHFRIIVLNPDSAKLGFEYSVATNYTISKVYQSTYGSDDLTELSSANYSPNKLAISHLKNGNGFYRVLVDVETDSIYRPNESFEFNVLIANTTPVVTSNRPLGKTTTKNIKLTFNPKQIYAQQGNCIFVIKNRDGAVVQNVVINSTSEDKNQTLNIASAGTYDIQVWSESGETLFYWTSITYKTPLNTVSIILIVIGSLIAIAAIVLFVVLRTRMKVR